MYKENENIIIFTDSEGVVLNIPKDPGNRDYQKYMIWLSEGNTPQVIEGEE